MTKDLELIKQLVTDLDDGIVTPDDRDARILSAMQEQAIKFAEFVSNNYVNMASLTDTPKWWKLKQEPEFKEYTTEEIYNEFNSL